MTTPAPEETRPGTEDGALEHLVCCDEDAALCGADVSEVGWGPGWDVVPPQDKCVVCLEMDEFVCPKCGE